MKDVAIKLPEVKGEIVPQDEATMLISQAIDKGVSVESLEKLLAMRKDLRAEKAKEAYDQAMAAFQGKCPIVERTKQGYNYKYAPIEVIAEQIKPYLAKNGLYYTFNTEEKENKILVCCTVTHTSGHSGEPSCATIAKEATTKMNASQQSGAQMTYGKRYSLMNALAITVRDEDTDAATTHNEPVSQQRSVSASSIVPQIPVKQEVREPLKPMMITNDQKVEIMQLLAKAKKSLPYLNNAIRSTKALKANTYQDLTYKNANTLIERMKREIEYPETPTNGDEEKIDMDEAEKGIEQQKLTN